MGVLADLLKDVLERTGWSFRQYGIKAGVDHTEIKRIADGERKRPGPDKLVKLARAAGEDEIGWLQAAGYLDALSPQPTSRTIRIPVIGEIRAGPPLLAIQEQDGVIEVPEETVQGGNYVFFRVKGDSMRNIGIVPDSLLLVRQTPEVPAGAIAIVLVDGEEATVKRVRYEHGKIVLLAENEHYERKTYDPSQVIVIGEVVEERKRFRNGY